MGTSQQTIKTPKVTHPGGASKLKQRRQHRSAMQPAQAPWASPRLWPRIPEADEATMAVQEGEA